MCLSCVHPCRIFRRINLCDQHSITNYYMLIIKCPSSIVTLTQFNVCCVAIQTMFQYVTGLMKQGYQEESNRQRHLAVSPKERPDKRSTALWDASSQPQTVTSSAMTHMFMYIVYLLSPFLHRSCLPQSLFATLKKQKNMQWLLTKHFISELKFCCRTQEHDETIQMVDKIYWLYIILPCNCDQQKRLVELQPILSLYS